MLRTLRIRDLVIVDDLTVEFGPGLNLLTGETGAGKSILVDALGLVSGARADRSAIRSGTQRASVEALFEPPPGSAPARWAVEHGLADEDDGSILIKRELAASGSGRCFVNGSPSTVSLLRELGGLLLELHGQHEQQSLLSPERHLDLLDLYGGHAEALERVGAAYGAVGAAREELERLQGERQERGRRIEELGRTLREIDELAPKPGDLERIDRELRILRNAGRMADLLAEVVGLSYEGESAAAPRAAAVARLAEELAGLDPELEELARRCRSAAVELQEAGSAFRDYRERADFDLSRLDALETRRVALDRLCLRHGVDEAGLAAMGEQAAAELSMLENIDREVERAQREVARAEQDYASRAAVLTRARREAVPGLTSGVRGQLARLALGKARFEVALTASRGPALEPGGDEAPPLNPRGAERAEFLLAANPGEPARALTQVASGGELSRVMLALHVVVETASAGSALVFDEVDAGIGGAVADAVGARLKRLARNQQVLCVTHLPQVAAYADRHYRVQKRVSQGRTKAGIDALSPDQRVEEVARMLAGKRPTPASRRHASELLSAAGRARPARAGRSA